MSSETQRQFTLHYQAPFIFLQKSKTSRVTASPHYKTFQLTLKPFVIASFSPLMDHLQCGAILGVDSNEVYRVREI